MTQCLDLNMQIPKVITEERVLKIMNGSIENMLARFQTTTV
jgi:hypothetical protein